MIEIKNISKSFRDGVYVLKEFNLSIQEGELILIKGKSGSGKSTLLALIAGILKPTEGLVIVDSKQISKLAEHFCSAYRRDNIGVIFQKYNLIEDLSVEENIALPLFPLEISKRDIDTKVARVMEAFHIEHKAKELVKNLSGGEQQRCAIARANVANPKIIIADEPTANLDEQLSLSFIEMLKSMKKEKKTIILATHDPLFFDLDFVDRVVDFGS